MYREDLAIGMMNCRFWIRRSNDLYTPNLNRILSSFLRRARLGLREAVQIDGTGSDLILAWLQSSNRCGVRDHAVTQRPGKRLTSGLIEAEDLFRRNTGRQR